MRSGLRSGAHITSLHQARLESNERIFSDSMKIVSSPTATTGSTRPTSTAWGRTATTGSATRPGSSSTPPGTRGWTPSVGTSSRASEGSPAAGRSASWMWFTIQVGCYQVCARTNLVHTNISPSLTRGELAYSYFYSKIRSLEENQLWFVFFRKDLWNYE